MARNCEEIRRRRQECEERRRLREERRRECERRKWENKSEIDWPEDLEAYCKSINYEDCFYCWQWC